MFIPVNTNCPSFYFSMLLYLKQLQYLSIIHWLIKIVEFIQKSELPRFKLLGGGRSFSPKHSSFPPNYRLGHSSHLTICFHPQNGPRLNPDCIMLVWAKNPDHSALTSSGLNPDVLVIVQLRAPSTVDGWAKHSGCLNKVWWQVYGSVSSCPSVQDSSMTCPM